MIDLLFHFEFYLKYFHLLEHNVFLYCFVRAIFLILKNVIWILTLSFFKPVYMNNLLQLLSSLLSYEDHSIGEFYLCLQFLLSSRKSSDWFFSVSEDCQHDLLDWLLHPNLFFTGKSCPPSNECPRYDTKQSDGEVPVMLELWGIWNTSSLPLLSGPFWLGVIAPDRVQLWVK